MHILTKIYNDCYNVLKLSEPMPKPEITGARAYFGKCFRSKDDGKNNYLKIKLSKNLLDLLDLETIYIKAIDTICHEFAHMYIWEHNKNHELLTKFYREKCLSILNKEKYLNDIQNIKPKKPYYFTISDVALNVESMRQNKLI
jgi:signal recognition particle GTPase